MREGEVQHISLVEVPVYLQLAKKENLLSLVAPMHFTKPDREVFW